MIKEVNKEQLGLEEENNTFRKYFAFIKENTIIGYFVIDIIYDRIELINIFVEEDKRRGKIGSTMLKYLIDYACENNILNITLEVKDNNIAALKLYEKFGFKKVALRKDYYSGTDGILMELII